MRAFLFDEQGKEISRSPRSRLGDPYGRGEAAYAAAKELFFRLLPVQRESRASSDGKHRYTLAMGLPPGPRVFHWAAGTAIPGLMIAMMSSGLVCYFLAWYMTKPVAQLRAATQQLGRGRSHRPRRPPTATAEGGTRSPD